MDTYDLKWSKSCDKYKDHLSYLTEIQDDEFLISFKRWSKIYDTLYLCSPVNREWKGIRLFDGWRQGKVSGFPKDPSEYKSYVKNNFQYLVTVPLDSNVIIAVN